MSVHPYLFKVRYKNMIHYRYQVVWINVNCCIECTYRITHWHNNNHSYFEIWLHIFEKFLYNGCFLLFYTRRCVVKFDSVFYTSFVFIFNFNKWNQFITCFWNRPVFFNFSSFQLLNIFLFENSFQWRVLLKQIKSIKKKTLSNIFYFWNNFIGYDR